MFLCNYITGAWFSSSQVAILEALVTKITSDLKIIPNNGTS